MLQLSAQFVAFSIILGFHLLAKLIGIGGNGAGCPAACAGSVPWLLIILAISVMRCKRPHVKVKEAKANGTSVSQRTWPIDNIV